MPRAALRGAVAEPCLVCGGPHPVHVVVRARSLRRWRGRNFDAAAAEGDVGAAVARALGLDPASPEGFARFAKAAVVAARREDLDLNPARRFDPAEGEAWEFHVAVREEVPPETAAEVERAVREAVAGAKGFAPA